MKVPEVNELVPKEKEIRSTAWVALALLLVVVVEVVMRERAGRSPTASN